MAIADLAPVHAAVDRRRRADAFLAARAALLELSRVERETGHDDSADMALMLSEAMTNTLSTLV